MKKLILLILLLVLGLQISVQASEDEAPEVFKRNDLKLDVAYLLASVAKVEYEYMITVWSSIGIAGFVYFGSADMDYKTQVLGLYRLYFGKKPNTGLFLEGNLGMTTGDSEPYWDYYSWQEQNYMAFSIGVALGWKYYIPGPNIVLDVFVGAGRLFSDKDNPGVYPRAGLCLGKRF